MRAELVVVTGVGTGVGKTHVSEALLLRWGRGAQVAGLKPVETGVDGVTETDGDRLERASTFHVKHSEIGLRFRAPLSPHLAAEREGGRIDPTAVVRLVERVRALCEGVVVELAGGLFSPLAVGFLNVDMVRALQPARTVLVAPDRLGVIHEVLATVRGAGDLPMDILVVSPESPDESSGTNAAELRRHQPHTVLGPLRRAVVEALADDASIAACLVRER